MAKMLEEERILEQQHIEAEQNRKTLIKHELVKRRGSLRQASVCSSRDCDPVSSSLLICTTMSSQTWTGAKRLFVFRRVPLTACVTMRKQAKRISV